MPPIMALVTCITLAGYIDAIETLDPFQRIRDTFATATLNENQNMPGHMVWEEPVYYEYDLEGE